MCAHCSKPLVRGVEPDAERAWCSAACMRAWDAEHPEEAVGWVPVDDMTGTQRAELLAMLGFGVRC